MKSLKKCTPKIHKEFSIGINRSCMRQLKNQNMILVLFILAKLSAAVGITDEMDCTEADELKNKDFECNNSNQVVDLTDCAFEQRSLLSISSCANVTGYFHIKSHAKVKFENIGILDVHMALPHAVEKLEFINIDRIMDFPDRSVTDVATLGLFRMNKARIDKFSALFFGTRIIRLELRNVVIESLETINILEGSKELTIIDCHFKNINGPINLHMFENITIERSTFVFSDFNNLSLAGNFIEVHNNTIINAAIMIKAEAEANITSTCGSKSSMHIASKNISSTRNFMQWEIIYDPPQRIYRDNNQICTEETCHCNYSNAGSIHSDVWYTLIFTVAFFHIFHSDFRRLMVFFGRMYDGGNSEFIK